MLEEDTKPDPRLLATPDELKAKKIDDFQLYYALQTIARLGGPQQVAAIARIGTPLPRLGEPAPAPSPPPTSAPKP